MHFLVSEAPLYLVKYDRGELDSVLFLGRALGASPEGETKPLFRGPGSVLDRTGIRRTCGTNQQAEKDKLIPL